MYSIDRAHRQLVLFALLCRNWPWICMMCSISLRGSEEIITIGLVEQVVLTLIKEIEPVTLSSCNDHF